MLTRLRVLVLLAVMAVAGVGGSQAASFAGEQDDTSTIVVDDPRTSESSGLAVSPADPGLVYTVNDSGHDPVVYVIDTGAAAVVGTTALGGADAGETDPEAVAVDGDGTLWLGDIGDNLRGRDDVALYALPAPGPGEASVTPQRYPLSHPDGPADAETLLADPVSGAMWVVTKGLLSGSVLQVPDPLAATSNSLELVPDVAVPGLVTDGTVLPDGSAAVLRTYERAYVYRLPDWEPVGDFALPPQEQGESLAALPDGSLLAGSEGTPTRIDRVSLPPGIAAALGAGQPAPTPDPTPDPTQDPTQDPTPAPTTAPDPSSDPDDDPADVLLGAGAVVAMLVAGGLTVALLRRRT